MKMIQVRSFLNTHFALQFTMISAKRSSEPGSDSVSLTVNTGRISTRGFLVSFNSSNHNCATITRMGFRSAQERPVDGKKDSVVWVTGAKWLETA